MSRPLPKEVSIEKIKSFFRYREEDYKIFLMNLKKNDPEYKIRKEIYEHSIRELKLLPHLLDEFLEKEVD